MVQGDVCVGGVRLQWPESDPGWTQDRQLSQSITPTPEDRAVLSLTSPRPLSVTVKLPREILDRNRNDY